MPGPLVSFTMTGRCRQDGMTMGIRFHHSRARSRASFAPVGGKPLNAHRSRFRRRGYWAVAPHQDAMPIGSLPPNCDGWERRRIRSGRHQQAARRTAGGLQRPPMSGSRSESPEFETAYRASTPATPLWPQPLRVALERLGMFARFLGKCLHGGGGGSGLSCTGLSS
jgi:hypothetical protein